MSDWILIDIASKVFEKGLISKESMGLQRPEKNGLLMTDEIKRSLMTEYYYASHVA